MSTGYAALTEAEQVDLLRGVATEAAPRFGLDVAGIDLVLHGFNTTFRVDTRFGERFALRVNTNSLSTPAHVRAQSAWMRALAQDTEVRIPVPIVTAQGEDVVAVERGGREHLVTVATWLAGDDVGECGPRQARELGKAMATMHEHALGFKLPDGTALTVFSDPYYGDADHLRPAYSDRPGDLTIVDRAWATCSAAMSRVAEHEPSIVIHGDLHGGNLKWHEGQLAVFDFDDCGIATASLDLSIATFYCRRGGDDVIEEELRAGYAEVRPLPEVGRTTAEALIASRQLLLANDLLRSVTPEFRAMRAEYLDRTVARLTRWRDTGRFSLL